MSSSSSYEPDNSEDSDFSIESNRGRQRQRRSLSHHEPIGLEPSTEHESIEQDPTDHGVAPVIEIDDDEPDSSQTLWDRLEALTKELRPDSLDRYKSLLEEVRIDAIVNKGIENEKPYQTTQNGAVIWTTTEKELLFNTLDRKGKDGIRNAAAAISTKSELEIMDYLRVIQRELEARHALDEELELAVMGDLPSAREISRECCAELDRYAEYLIIQEDIDTEKTCRAKYIDNALICAPQAKSLVEKDVNPPLRGSIHLAANLLHVPGFIQLSSQVFMNFGGPRAEDSWNEIVKSSKESPGLYGDALMDIYALTMSITRRLIQSTMFFAMARLRSLSGIGRARKQAVRKRDVRAAVDVLNMRPNRSGFFVDVARRNQLVIIDDENHTGPISYEEAEEILDQDEEDENSDAEEEDPASASENEDDDNEEGDEEDKIPVPDAASSQSNQDPSSSHPQPNKARPPDISWDIIPMDLEEKHADLLDIKYSQAEERRLWRILDTPVPRHLNIPIVLEGDEKKHESMEKPRSQRKSKEELVDWRDRTLYRGEWEEYGEGLEDLEEELAENRRKRRRSVYELEKEADTERPRPKKTHKGSLSTGIAEHHLDDEGQVIKAPIQRIRRLKKTNKNKSSAPLSAEIVEDDSDDESGQAAGDDNGEAVEAPIEVENHDQMDVDKPSSPAPSPSSTS